MRKEHGKIDRTGNAVPLAFRAAGIEFPMDGCRQEEVQHGRLSRLAAKHAAIIVSLGALALLAYGPAEKWGQVQVWYWREMLTTRTRHFRVCTMGTLVNESARCVEALTDLTLATR